MNKDRRILPRFWRLVKETAAGVLFLAFSIEQIRIRDRRERGDQNGSDGEGEGLFRPCRQRRYENSREYEGFRREAVRAVPDRFVGKGPGGADSKEEVRPDLPEIVSHEHEEGPDSERNERSDVRFGIRRYVLGYEKQVREERKERHLDRFPRFLELRVRILFRIDVRHGYEKCHHQREETEKSERRYVFRREVVRYSLDIPMNGNRLRKEGIEVVRRSGYECRGCRAENVDGFYMIWG